MSSLSRNTRTLDTTDNEAGLDAAVSPYKAPRLYTLSSGSTFLAHDSKGFLEAFRDASLDSVLLQDVWPKDRTPESLTAKEFAEVLQEGLLQHLNVNVRTYRGLEVFVDDLKRKGILLSVTRVN